MLKKIALGILGSATKQQMQPKPAPLDNDYFFNVAGINHHYFELEDMGKRIKKYDLPDNELIKLDKFRQFEYYFPIDDVQLIPEPDNLFDKNAIAVYINNVKIGYVPAVITDVIARYMVLPHTVTASIRGGRYKELTLDGIIKGTLPYSCTINICLR